jgi:hypothetical protein
MLNVPVLRSTFGKKNGGGNVKSMGHQLHMRLGPSGPEVSTIHYLRVLSNNENRTAIAFQTAELSIIEYDIFKFFPVPPHLEPEMEMKPLEFFFPVWCA